MKFHFEKFLEDNKIINPNHHGGRKNFSTTTALTQILHTIGKNYENDNVVSILITDLSKAYDTVDHKILLLKMEHYGVRGAELEIFKSYFANRKQLVHIDTERSEVIDSLDCSVIQGSKLAGLFYNLYTNEIPEIHKIMNMDIFTQMTGKPNNNPKMGHETINFVDDYKFNFH